MLKLLKGDDSGEIVLNPQFHDGYSTAGKKLVFEIEDFKREWTDFGNGLRFSFPKEWTKRQRLGRHLGRWSIVNADGTVTTATNTFPVYLTEVVEDLNGDQTETVSFVAGGSLSGMTFNPNGTSQEIITFLANAVRALGATVQGE